MSRARWISLGVLALLVALLPFLPRGGGDGGAIRNSGRQSSQPRDLTAGYGRVTPAYRREIDQVVAAGRAVGRISPDAPARTLIGSLTRCAVFEGQRYCLGTGWTDQTPAQVEARLGVVAARESARSTPVVDTGALGVVDVMREQARLSPSARAAAQRAELLAAARSVAKIWLIRHEIQGVPLPPHFFRRHPEVRDETAPLGRDRASSGTPGQASQSATATPTPTPTATATTPATTAPTSGPTTPVTGTPTLTGTPTATTTPSPMMVRHWRDYPSKGVVLHPKDVSEQNLTYWCGPTSLQMITWGWRGRKQSQAHWADKLGTTTGGTSTAQMAQAVNEYTGYDRKSYAGPYVMLDVSDWTFRQWMLLMARHIVDYRAPVILNPLLHTEFFPYLDHDGGGHFQVGRGYEKRDGKTPMLGYFEPWNQQRFHPDEPYIGRVQWRNAYKSYRADLANFAQLGV